MVGVIRRIVSQAKVCTQELRSYQIVTNLRTWQMFPNCPFRSLCLMALMNYSSPQSFFPRPISSIIRNSIPKCGANWQGKFRGRWSQFSGRRVRDRCLESRRVNSGGMTITTSAKLIASYGELIFLRGKPHVNCRCPNALERNQCVAMLAHYKPSYSLSQNILPATRSDFIFA